MDALVHDRKFYKAVCLSCGDVELKDIRPLDNNHCPLCASRIIFFELSKDERRDLGRLFHVSQYFPNGGVTFVTVHTSQWAKSAAVIAFFLKVFLSDVRESLTLSRRKVRNSPGSTLLRIADFLYSPVTVEKIFKQEVADWRLEYFEALQEGRHWKARWISCRHYWAIAKAVGLDRLVSWFDRVLRRI